MTYQNLGYWVGQANDVSTGAHPTGWTNGQRWSETAGEWNTMYNSSQSALATANSNYSTLQGQYNTLNSQYTTLQGQYNALLAGLNNPEGMVTQAISTSWGSGAPSNSGTTTLNLSRAGHWMIAIAADISCSPTQGNSFVTAHVSGAVTDNRQNDIDTGSASFRYGYVGHLDIGAPSSVAIYFEGFVAAGSASGTMYAHFVPNATYHN